MVLRAFIYNIHFCCRRNIHSLVMACHIFLIMHTLDTVFVPVVDVDL